MKATITAVAFALALSACSGSGSAPSVPSASALPSWQIAAIGDSISRSVAGTSDPNQSYPQFVATALGASAFSNLSVPSTTCSWMTANEVPQIPLGTNLVLVNCGTNDVDQQVSNATDFPALITGIKARVPAARILVVTIRVVFPASPYSTQAAIDTWNAMEKAVPGVTIVDIQNDHALDGLYPDNVHPALMASQLIALRIVAALGAR